VLGKLEQLKDHLKNPDNLSVHISTDADNVKKFANLTDPWKKYFAGKSSGGPVVSVNAESFAMHLNMVEPSLPHVLYPLGSCESSFLIRCAPAISDPRDPDLPGLMLYLQYINQLEGPMWRQIRGAGYAYGYAMYPDVTKGLLYFSLYRATNAANAFAEAKKIALDSLESNEDIDESLFESAKPSLIFELIEKEKTVGDVVYQSLVAFFKQTDRQFQHQFLKKITAVSQAEMKKSALKYIKILFDESACRTAVVCSTAKVTEIQKEFKDFGVDLTKVDSLDQFK
jgi:Zn-dependent M16 (insulinase) family peptidase